MNPCDFRTNENCCTWLHLLAIIWCHFFSWEVNSFMCETEFLNFFPFIVCETLKSLQILCNLDVLLYLFFMEHGLEKSSKTTRTLWFWNDFYVFFFFVLRTDMNDYFNICYFLPCFWLHWIGYMCCLDFSFLLILIVGLRYVWYENYFKRTSSEQAINLICFCCVFN